jgi:hypothetical protein
MSTQGDRAVELSASYANRTDEDIHVVLQLAEELSFPVAPRLQLKAGKRLVRAETTSSLSAAGTTFEARVPAADLRPGVWHLALVGADDEVVGVEARLLNSRKQPVALLPGPVPRTELPAPRPAAAPTSGRVRAYQAAARVANKGLGLLPEQRAARYRSVLKKAGRRVL